MSQFCLTKYSLLILLLVFLMLFLLLKLFPSEKTLFVTIVHSSMKHNLCLQHNVLIDSGLWFM